ncbi:MAG: hypothetical protein JWN86_552 [Planctomycetota bacterium]|nr:hypothetical protein [Planctomycetota bacterium]
MRANLADSSEAYPVASLCEMPAVLLNRRASLPSGLIAQAVSVEAVRSIENNASDPRIP